ncbi:Arc family DNA-binding protein [Mesorhizobium sp. M00.F.Ca.ET.186.01.1.1]|nr:Arc family DNA-binding protein [bacterium M00.F.Ca.ET.205.01.1.1]TGU52969.1 Arc family DNA-binding protein [bacterium M00.F.Ca.ET.152.01.1.1]TGV35939.1 Arc family DNA-binding protein [Mesorhizobium sp. M00.F.Ca.ET.186.01.1.1]TGZ43521.1 Arc family DNA-binding protein [bacterium M00.F.Ca.ET.162.01.1.1]
MPTENRLTIHIRLTPSLIKQIKVSAAESGRSMNAEIAARIERSFSTDDADRMRVSDLLAQALAILDKGQVD